MEMCTNCRHPKRWHHGPGEFAQGSDQLLCCEGDCRCSYYTAKAPLFSAGHVHVSEMNPAPRVMAGER